MSGWWLGVIIYENEVGREIRLAGGGYEQQEQWCTGKHEKMSFVGRYDGRICI